MGKKVLIIEDEELIAAVLKDNLEMVGYEVSIANSGVEGFRRAKRTPPDIITLDVMMPNLSGIQVLKDLKADDATKDIPVIILSVEGDPNRNEGLKLGAFAFLRKPVDFSILNQKIKSITEKKKVLVIEDSPVVLKVLEIKLASLGYEVICISDGKSAIEKAIELKPDVILMDIILPHEDGFSITKKLKKNKKTANIPVIAFSGQFSESIDEKEVVGVDKFLNKEFSVEDLALEVSRMLKKLKK